MSEQQNKVIEHKCYASRTKDAIHLCDICQKPITSSSLTMEEKFVEKGAELEHIRWAKWQNYLHTFLVWNNEIQMWTLPHEKKEWWDSEIRTPYSMLTEKQKESDRKEARQYLPLLSSTVSQALKEQRDTTLKLIDKYYLQYCREQNGLDHCKNCGLNIEELEKLLSNNKE